MACEDLQVVRSPLSVQSIATANDTCMYVYDTFSHSRQEAINDKNYLNSLSTYGQLRGYQSLNLNNIFIRLMLEGIL